MKVGEVVGVDYARDGDCDHTGFVSEVASKEEWHGSKYYRDYKIAQHTRDYHEWASSELNDWETAEDYVYYYLLLNE